MLSKIYESDKSTFLWFYYIYETLRGAFLWMFLSGVFFPYEFLPDFLQPIVRVLPLTYLGDALRQVMLGLSGARTLQHNILILTLFLVISAGLTVKFWRWE